VIEVAFVRVLDGVIEVTLGATRSIVTAVAVETALVLP
jgi:hypothetical protein